MATHNFVKDKPFSNQARSMLQGTLVPSVALSAPCAGLAVVRGKTGSHPVKHLLQYINGNFCDPTLNVKVAKAVCNISDHNISCRFKHEVGTTIREYILALRMDAARKFLENSDLPITEIAYEVGYWHVQTFYRVFEKCFKCTPHTYRQSYRITLSNHEAMTNARRDDTTYVTEEA